MTTIWNTTRPRETSATRRLVPPRPPPSRSTAFVSAPDDIHAGSRPDATAAPMAATTETASTTRSTSNVIHDGGGVSRLRTDADSQSIEKYASAMPIAAPIEAISRLSVSICRTSRARDAPSDDRTASSLARSIARANCMFITFTHAMSSTPTQKPSIVRSVPRSGRGVKVLISGSTCPVLNVLFVAGYAAAMRRASAVNSAFA